MRVAGCTPIATGLIGEYFSVEYRSTALGLYNTGIYIGYSLAFGLGNFVAGAHGWRVTFIALGLPGIGLAVLLYFTVKEPHRDLSPIDSATASADAVASASSDSVAYNAYAVAAISVPSARRSSTDAATAQRIDVQPVNGGASDSLTGGGVPSEDSPAEGGFMVFGRRRCVCLSAVFVERCRLVLIVLRDIAVLFWTSKPLRWLCLAGQACRQHLLYSQLGALLPVWCFGCPVLSVCRSTHSYTV